MPTSTRDPSRLTDPEQVLIASVSLLNSVKRRKFGRHIGLKRYTLHCTFTGSTIRPKCWDDTKRHNNNIEGNTIQKKLRVKMSKEIVSLGICSTLSLAVIVGVFNWMDGNAGLSSESALRQAELSVARYCQQQGISAADLELLDATAPEGGKHGWQFRFKPPGGSPITVEIDQGAKGQASVET